MSTFDPLSPVEPWVDSDGLCCPVDGVDEEVVTAAIAVASDVLHGLSGRQFGVRTSVETVTRSCTPPRWSRTATYPRQLPLTGTPVQSVTSVVEDDVELVHGTDYRVDDWRVLVRIGQRWGALTEVTYVWGLPVPPSGVAAAGELACEVLKACKGDDSCALSPRVREVARRGVTVALLDPTVFLDSGRLGLPLCDLFLVTHNPNGLLTRSRICSPQDAGRHRFRDTSPVTPGP